MARWERGGRHEREMRAVLERWQQSGLPLWRFADSEGISRNTLYRWRRRTGIAAEDLRRRDRARAAEDVVGAPVAAPLFAEVSSLLRPSSSPAMAMAFEVVLGDGTTVRVPQRFDPASLRALLAVLRAC
jgi:hypothetical protein